MAARYWVGGAANWDGTAGSKWALTSGGAGGQAVPTAADDVFLDAASGAVTVTINAASACRSLDCTGFTGTLLHNAFLLTVGDGTTGHFKFVPGMTYTASSIRQIAFASTTTGNQITTAGKTLGTLSFTGAGGGWTLLDNLTCSVLSHTNGALDLSGRTITTNGGAGFGSSGAQVRSMNLTNATVNSLGTFQLGTNSATYTLTGSTINLSAPSGSLSLNAQTYNVVNLIGGATFTIPAAGTFVNLTINGPAAIVRAGGAATVSGVLTIGPTACSVGSSTAGVRRTIDLSTTGTAMLTNVTFTDIAFTGTNTPVSGTGLVDGGNNTGITFVTTHTAAASVAGAGSVAAAATRIRLAAASISGTGAVAATATRTAIAQAQVAGTGGVNASGGVTRFATGSVSGTGTIAGTAARGAFAAAGVTGGGVVAASAILGVFVAASVSGTGTIAATATTALADDGSTEWFAGPAMMQGIEMEPAIDF